MVDSPPFRADHVGSLLRPMRLLQARADRAEGRLDDPDELRRIEDDAIRDAVALQERVGLRSVTDGEFRRASWHMDFIYQLGGIHTGDESLTVHFHNEQGDLDFQSAALKVDDRVTLDRVIFADAFSVPAVGDDHGGARSSPFRHRAWSTTGAAGPPSTRPCTRSSTGSGTT